MVNYLTCAVIYNTKAHISKIKGTTRLHKAQEKQYARSIFCDLAHITNTHFFIHLSIKIKTFQCIPLFTQLKVLGKPYARSFGPSRNIIIYNTHLQKSLKTLRGFFFLRSRLDETTVGPLIPAIDNKELED